MADTRRRHQRPSLVPQGDVIQTVLDEFDVRTTQTVLGKLEETGDYYDDAHAAATVLDHRDRLTVHEADDQEFTSSQIDAGEGSCVVLAVDVDADFVPTDDLRALPELQNLVAEVVISPIVPNALVTRGVLDSEAARNRGEQIAESLDLLGAPIYRRALQLFD